MDEVAEPTADFFDVTVDDLKSQLDSLREQSSDQFSLISRHVVRQKNEQAMKKAYKFSVIRVQFVDGTILQGTFRSIEKVSAIYHFVQSFLDDDNLGFDLVMPINKTLNQLDQTLIQANLAPRAMLIFKCRNQDAQKLAECLKKLSTHIYRKSQAEAELTAQECLLLNETFVPYQPPKATLERLTGGGHVTYESQSSSSKIPPRNVPKWLKK
uniref:UBX domain-containing protein n=1 Tax=Romanomermis culicivorax TaxID=13658 RepID=A0A915JA14_ROMCU